jgi:secondary thiamine-phosphate synthase enzyme
MIHQQSFTITTRGRGTYEITDRLREIARAAGVQTGLAHVFVHHTSASLILCENADPAVRRDLETFMARLAPDGAAWMQHDDEGPDDMPAHIRTVLTQNSLTLPVTGGRCALGTWQGVYLWEHRSAGHGRKVTVTVWGE